MKQSVFLQFYHQGPKPSVDEVREWFSLGIDEIDFEYGVIASDPSKGLYTVLVEAQASERIKAVLATRPQHPDEGLFSNPMIAPMGPPEK